MGGALAIPIASPCTRIYREMRRPCESRDPYAAALQLSAVGRRLYNNRALWLWVPAFAGTTFRMIRSHAIHSHSFFTFQTACHSSGTASRSRRLFRARFASSFTLLESRGRRESRVRAAPAVSRAKCNIEDAHEHTGSAEAIRPSLHDGLRLTSRSPRRPGFFATVIPEKLASQELDTSVGVSGPHDFAVRLSAVRQ